MVLEVVVLEVVVLEVVVFAVEPFLAMDFFELEDDIPSESGIEYCDSQQRIEHLDRHTPRRLLRSGPPCLAKRFNRNESFGSPITGVPLSLMPTFRACLFRRFNSFKAR